MKISVALCSFNGDRFLRQQIESILNQTLPVDEIIISDDGSSDGTLEIIREYEQKHCNLFKVHTNPFQLGTIKNFEIAVGICSGDIIFLSDQDDIWLPEKVRCITDFFKKHKDALLVFTNAYLIDEDNKVMSNSLWEKWDFTKELQDKWKDNRKAFQDLLVNRNKVTGATVAFRSVLRGKALPVFVRNGYWHDAWLALHAAAMNGLYFIQSPLINYRIHASQQVGVGTMVPRQEYFGASYVSTEDMNKKIVERYPKLFTKDSKIKGAFKKVRNLINIK